MARSAENQDEPLSVNKHAGVGYRR